LDGYDAGDIENRTLLKIKLRRGRVEELRWVQVANSLKPDHMETKP
jgi:hypothetical protein